MTIGSTISVWHATASADQPGTIESCCESWLELNEIERANRFRRSTTRNQHVIGRGMARRLLGQSKISPLEIRFGEQTHGKPYVAGPNAAKQPFNIAHTEGLVICGVGDNAHDLIGLDVERLDRHTEAGLADRYFSQPEIDYLRGKRSQQARQDAFLRVWTLKESFIKAIGTGLQTPLADFTFVDIDSPTPQIKMLNEDLQDARDWHFFSIVPRAGFVAAVAVASAAEVSLNLKCFDELIEADRNV